MHDTRHDPWSTNDLLQRAGTGDQDAFAAFYDRVASRVYGTTLRILRSSALAEEVTQEVFVEVWRLSAGFDPARGSASTWITTIAHRRSVDRVRSTEAARRRDASWHDRTTLNATAGPDFSQGSVETLAVQSALSQLSPPQLDAIRLAYFEGYTYQEVARLMEAPLGTTKSRIRDALARLRVVMDAQPTGTA